MKKPNFMQQRRKLLALTSISALSPVWVKPMVNTVILPAHAQTSMCVTDITVGGPLSGSATGAATCQEACQTEADNRSAMLCSVTETPTATGTDCSCDLDLP